MPTKPTSNAPTESTEIEKSELLFVGTYTRKEGHVDGKANGIYILKMNTETGELTAVDTITNQINPSYLTIHPNGKYLYAVNEIADANPEHIGTVSAFSFDANTNKAEFLNAVSSQGDAPCHVSIDASGKFVLVANYVGGTVSSYPILADGSLGNSIVTHIHQIRKVNLPRQEAAHAHMIVPGITDNAVFAVDLGINQVIQYNLDSTGMMNRMGEITLTEGAGPRHLAFHPTLNRMYVLGELNHSIETFKYENGNDDFELVQVADTWGKSDSEGMVNCAAIKIHPNGQFLYASNRDIKSDTENSIAMFKVDTETGELTFLGTQDSKGLIPRDFEIDPSGKFLLVANQNSDSIVTFKINSKTGMLEETGFVKEVMTPVCLKFMQ
ncbi:lactonase family protein [Saprospiraceae bacterium]|nr:lactonase family protein [Saprospiraceae bacterium]